MKKLEGALDAEEMGKTTDALRLAIGELELPTRRERIATAALQGLLAGDYAEAAGVSHEDRALDAVRYADALIVELDRATE